MSRVLNFVKLFHRKVGSQHIRSLSLTASAQTPNQTYTSTLAESFYNEEQMEIQRSFRKVSHYGLIQLQVASLLGVC